MKKTILFIAFIAVSMLFFSISSSHANVKTSEFNLAYKQYINNLNNNSEQTDLANEALALFEMSKTVSGEQHPNSIMLLISAANHFRNADELETATKHYDVALSLIEDSELESSLTHINLLVEILDTRGLTTFRDRNDISQQLYKELKSFFEETDPNLTLLASLNAFSTMIENRDLGIRFSKLNSFAKRLLGKAEELLPANSAELIRAQFNHGILLHSMEKDKDAINAFVKVVDVISTNTDYSHPYEVAAHSRLVNLFEKRGDSEAATEHCVAIGQMTPWQDDIKPQPLFRLDPKYPTSFARKGKGGWVLLSFDITSYGFVENIKVLDSSSKGFEEPSIKAIESWRYAPKFENGKAVKAEGMQVQLDFSIGKPSRNFENI